MVRYTDGMDLTAYDRMAIVDSQALDIPSSVLKIPVVSA